MAVRNEATGFLRRQRRREEHEFVRGPVETEDGDVEDLLAELRTLSTPSLVPVRADLLDRVLQLLPPGAAEVLRLRFVDDLDAAAVADRFGIERAAVDQRVARAKRLLRAALLTHPELAAELRLAHPRPHD